MAGSSFADIDTKEILEKIYVEMALLITITYFIALLNNCTENILTFSDIADLFSPCTPHTHMDSSCVQPCGA